MEDIQWEYCEVGLVKWKRQDRSLLNSIEGMCYECYIRFFRSEGSGEIFYNVTTLDEVVAFNPFAKVLAQLGSFGWEVITIQHGNASSGDSALFDNAIIWDNRAAYLKRPVLQGRTVDEPKLVM